MSQTDRDLTQWPDRIVYVCSAGGAINVNVAPMVQAGKGRVAGIVVAEGISTPNQPNLTDEREASIPVRAILDFGRSFLKLPESAMRVYRGNGDLIGDWLGLLSFAQELAEQLNARVLFNLAGGRKPMTIGGLFGAPRRGLAAPPVYLTVGMNAFTLRLVELTVDGAVIERPLPVRRHLDLRNYLAMYGIEEDRPAQRQNAEQSILAQTEALAYIEQLLASGRAHSMFAPLLRAIANTSSAPCTIRLPKGGFPPETNDLLAFLTDCSVSDSGLKIESTESLYFLKGDWLEALCLRAVRSALAGCSDSSVLGKFAFRRIGFSAVESEFDLLVYGRDRITIGECKAVTTIHTLREGINRLDRYRSELSGRVGRAWLVAPLLQHRQLNGSGCLYQAKSQAVELFYGREAIRRVTEAAVVAFRH